MTPALIALDWGTSSLRGFLMDASGAVLDSRASPHGITNLPGPAPEGFDLAFEALCGAWLQADPTLPVAAGGMIGSSQGWREAPYVACPADLQRLASQAVSVITRQGVELLIAPGVLADPPGGTPDVIRGEEIQIAGALAQQPSLAARGHFLMPGTHSKWVAVEGGRITRFATYMTGELFAVLRQHSLLGRLMPAGEEGHPDEAAAAFTRGLQLARDSHPGDLTRQIFAARSLGLTKQMAPAVLKDFLSGLLIGHELVSGLAAAGRDTALALIGDPALCERYATGLAALGAAPPRRLGNTAPAGLFHFARAAGLLATARKMTP
ncbi:2-keto-3-deoxy-galactonokinase [Pseudoroseomonas deserti]|uniref:2-keto-3-deoxy-galactonokinase n=1 Tax=Teichococcus deserti TaxID=1817963 RepID=A0A1V2GX97_9PROT|nr:2-dehydro-3-deoxygalactonokinase [Pseudoroseomonas deserti]ONG48997.1 2-keto-3-deoxy-galactonokinase [Pseudoroseomonas deserti]